MKQTALTITLPLGHPAGRQLSQAMGDLAQVEIECRVWHVIQWSTEPGIVPAGFVRFDLHEIRQVGLFQPIKDPRPIDIWSTPVEATP